jgi:hypothetical protein
VARIENTCEKRLGLKLSQAIWAWTVYGRHFAEWPSAVWPMETPARAAAFEHCQVRALIGLLGDAVPRGLYRGSLAHVNPGRALVLSVFGLWELSERRLLSRLRFSAACTLSTVLPRRTSLKAHTMDLLQRPASEFFDRELFLKLSPSAAIAVADEIARGFGPVDTAADEGPTDDGPAEDEVDGQVRDGPGRVDDGGSDDQVPGMGDDGSDMDVDDDGEEDDYDPRAGEDDEPEASLTSIDAVEEACNNSDDPLRAVRGVLGGRAGKLVAAIAKENRAARLEQLNAPSELYKALAPSQTWLKDVVREQELDGELAAFVALLIGSWWAAPAVRLPGRYCKGVCGACGQQVSCLAVHLIIGVFDGVFCPGAREVRKIYSKEVFNLFSDYGLLERLRATPPASMERLAFMLGNGGNGMPALLARLLPTVFCDTFGRWSAANAPKAPRILGDDADMEEDDEDDDEDNDDDGVLNYDDGVAMGSGEGEDVEMECEGPEEI